MKLKVLFLFFLFFSVSSTVDCYGATALVDRQNFLESFKQNGSAFGKYDSNSGVQELTTGSNQSGNIAFQNAIDIGSNFSFKGAFNFGQYSEKDGLKGVADGIGIVFYPNEPSQIGKTAGNLGINGIPNAFAWKLDTWDNSPGNNDYVSDGDDDTGLQVPYGGIVETNQSGYGHIDKESVINFPKTLTNGQFYDVEIKYENESKTFSIFLNVDNKIYKFSKQLNLDFSNPYFFSITASTGGLPTIHKIRFDSFVYSKLEKVTFRFIDDTTNKIIENIEAYGQTYSLINESTGYKNYIEKLNKLQQSGYEITSNNFNERDIFKEGNKTYEIHLKQIYQLEKPKIFQYLTVPLDKSSDVIGSISECDVEYN
ncbi:hypothetical protein NXK88_002873, partial [Enterococcus hirae]|nr:hypothetical protein [Enterococcus hirae]